MLPLLFIPSARRKSVPLDLPVERAMQGRTGRAGTLASFMPLLILAACGKGSQQEPPAPRRSPLSR